MTPGISKYINYTEDAVLIAENVVDLQRLLCIYNIVNFKMNLSGEEKENCLSGHNYGVNTYI